MYANDFYEILDALQQNDDLKERVQLLIGSERIAGKATEGGERAQAFKKVLGRLIDGEITLPKAYRETNQQIPQHTSIHARNSRVFSDGWSERLVRTQLSRFYNQAVLEELLEQGVEDCYIPHSDHEHGDSPCTQYLAGTERSVAELYRKLVGSYRDGNWSSQNDLKIPNHPHCTHVVRPPKTQAPGQDVGN